MRIKDALAVNSHGNQIAAGGIDNCAKLRSARDMKKEIDSSSKSINKATCQRLSVLSGQ